MRKQLLEKCYLNVCIGVLSSGSFFYFYITKVKCCKFEILVLFYSYNDSVICILTIKKTITAIIMHLYDMPSSQKSFKSKVNEKTLDCQIGFFKWAGPTSAMLLALTVQ